jgi:hypothetical protein
MNYKADYLGFKKFNILMKSGRKKAEYSELKIYTYFLNQCLSQFRKTFSKFSGSSTTVRKGIYFEMEATKTNFLKPK